MAKDEKMMCFANFNITYGKNEEPMLVHFEDIIFPAFHSKFKRGKFGEWPVFYFDDIDIKNINNEYVLVGNYIKDTQYDVHTTVKNNQLVSTPAQIPTAPYSRFIIFLCNHRMVLVRNESQSPDIRSFQKTVRQMLNSYIRSTNRGIKEKDKKLPNANVNIVDIPLRYKIEEVLKNVRKIKRLIIRFFPLNNDISPIPIAQHIDEEMKKINSKSANIQFNSPGSTGRVIDLVNESAGLANPVLYVEDANGNNTKITNEHFASSKTIPFGRDILPDDDEHIITQAKQDEVISQISTENNKMYKKFKTAIARLIN